MEGQIQDFKNIENLVKELTLSREHSMLGKYDDSLKGFKDVLKKI